MDGVAYAMGQTDELKGTGMLSFIELKREKPEDEEAAETKAPNKETANAK